MNTFRISCVAALALMAFSSTSVAQPPPPPMDGPVDGPLFHDDLAPYGTWLRMDDYGWVWSPADVDPEWRPYTRGRWDYTDEGWYWSSSERWGAIPFHYGRWTVHPRYGWVWIPGRVWAPAWVTWRSGPGYIGWAPLPPTAIYYPSRGVVWTVGVDVAIQPTTWVFVDERYVMRPSVHLHMVPRSRGLVLYRSTSSVRHVYERRGDRVINHGVGRRRVESAAGSRVNPRPIRESERVRPRSSPRDQPRAQPRTQPRTQPKTQPKTKPRTRKK